MKDKTKAEVKDEAAKTPANPFEARKTDEARADEDRGWPGVPDEGPQRPDPAIAATYAAPDGAPVERGRPADAYHVEPSTYTPAGARPGQQNPVNPQGSPNADPHATEVGARPSQLAPIHDQGYDGDFRKVMTEGEKNPSQLPVDVEREEYHAARAGKPWMHNDDEREREMKKKRGE